MNRVDRALEALAAAQYGVISRRQAIQAGLSSHAIDRRIAAGRWIVVHAGVYRFGAAPETWESRVMAAQLWAGDDALLSHRTAAAIWQLEGIPAQIMEVTIPGSKKTAGVEVHRIRGSRTPSRSLNGFRVTGVERTLLDLCSVLPPRQCGKGLDDALRRRITTLDRLRRMCDESPGRSGCRTLRQLLALRDDRDGRTASQLETRLLRILKRIREERFVPQYRVDVSGHTYYIDFAFPQQKVGVEGHSIKWHLGEEQFKSDVRRDRRLSLLGWTILYFCRDDVWFDPQGVEADVREALAASVRNTCENRR